jgi:hypothetical protein
MTALVTRSTRFNIGAKAMGKSPYQQLSVAKLTILVKRLLTTRNIG